MTSHPIQSVGVQQRHAVRPDFTSSHFLKFLYFIVCVNFYGIQIIVLWLFKRLARIAVTWTRCRAHSIVLAPHAFVALFSFNLHFKGNAKYATNKALFVDGSSMAELAF